MKYLLVFMVLFGSLILAQNKVIDLTECNLKISNYEFVDELDGLEVDKENSKIIVIHLTGVAPFEGNLTCVPTLLNIKYINEDKRPEISPSRAFGTKGRTNDGKYVEHWLNVEDNFGDVCYFDYDKDSNISIYFAFDIPEYVKEFELLIPSKLQKIKL